MNLKKGVSLTTLAVNDFEFKEDLIKTGNRKKVANLIHWIMKKEKDEDKE